MEGDERRARTQKPEPLSFVLCLQEKKKSLTHAVSRPRVQVPRRDYLSKLSHGRIRRPPEVAEHQLRSRWRQPTDPPNFLICVFFSASSGVRGGGGKSSGHTQAGGPPHWWALRSRLTSSVRVTLSGPERAPKTPHSPDRAISHQNGGRYVNRHESRMRTEKRRGNSPLLVRETKQKGGSNLARARVGTPPSLSLT